MFESDDTIGFSACGEIGAAEKTLKVDHEIVAAKTQFLIRPVGSPEQSEESLEFPAGKRNDLMQKGDAVQNRAPFGVGKPIDFCLRSRPGEALNGGNRVYNISERARFDDQDSLDVSEIQVTSRVRGDAPAFPANRRR